MCASAWARQPVGFGIAVRTALRGVADMIGVSCKADEREAVREFFELFKTPWEFLRDGRDYEVILTTRGEDNRANARLLLMFSSTPTDMDRSMNIESDPIGSDFTIGQDGCRIPIYGRLAQVRAKGRPVLFSADLHEPVAIWLAESECSVVRVGYDLFREVSALLGRGQPARNALIPAIDLHIAALRGWIVQAGIPLVEIPPVPWGFDLIACLTHDVDFGGIRNHRFDHTMWGFIYRALVGSPLRFARRELPLHGLVRNWAAVLSLPLVHAGLRKDFWDQLASYADLERGFSATFFMIPFKGRIGDRLNNPHAYRRAAKYDISDMKLQVRDLMREGFEIGVHGIDAWHSTDLGRQELDRIAEVTREEELGVRIHWLCFDERSPKALEDAGFSYDSSCGYNEAIGYKAGTGQVFRPLGLNRLLELPLHIHDTALFLPNRMGLSERAAWDTCQTVLEAASRSGGTVTVLWHERSLAPERQWAGFYIRLLRELVSRRAWFGTAAQVVDWFRTRRGLRFQDVCLKHGSLQVQLSQDEARSPVPFTLRVHLPSKSDGSAAAPSDRYLDVPLSGQSRLTVALPN